MKKKSKKLKEETDPSIDLKEKPSEKLEKATKRPEKFFFDDMGMNKSGEFNTRGTIYDMGMRTINEIAHPEDFKTNFAEIIIIIKNYVRNAVISAKIDQAHIEIESDYNLPKIDTLLASPRIITPNRRGKITYKRVLPALQKNIRQYGAQLIHINTTIRNGLKEGNDFRARRINVFFWSDDRILFLRMIPIFRGKFFWADLSIYLI